MINILMSGCNGKMGQVITRMASDLPDKFRVVAGYDISGKMLNDYPVYTDLKDLDPGINIDVMIDFSNPSALDNLLKFVMAKKVPAIFATTGLSHLQIEKLKDCSKEVPIFFSANMSLGINLLMDLVKKAAKVLEGNFDIEIIEKHHNQKIDAPSGTALAIADNINSVLNENYEYIYDRHSRIKKRSNKEIGIHAVRGGTIVGEHSVIFAGIDEIFEIKHSAMSKEIFANGALKAAEYLHDKKPGFYSMNDLIGEIKS